MRGIRLIPIVCLSLICLFLPGCRPTGPSAAVVKARQLLPIDQSQSAIDALTSDKSAEACYLRAIALYRLHLQDAAQEQVQAALQADPQNPKYQAYELRMKLLLAKENREPIAKQLLALCDQHKSVAEFSLFAAAAHAVLKEIDKGRSAFATCVTLADQIPEFWPEILNLAVDVGDLPAAESIIGRMHQLSPKEPYVRRQQVLILAASGKADEAVGLARELYDAGEGSEELALLYAQAIVAATPSPASDEVLEQLLTQHPRHTALIILYATYLGKSGRLQQALTRLNQLAAGQPAAFRQALAPIMIGLALESENVELATAQIERSRTILSDPALLAYYEGRLCFLEQKYDEAAQLLSRCLELKKGDVDQNRQILSEAFYWLQKSQFEQRVQERIKKATDAVKAEAAKTPAP